MDPGKMIIVVFGLGKDDKPRASRFDADEAEAAAKAAGLMGLSVARAETPLAIALAKELPEGRLFKTGKAFTPLVKWGRYDKICRVLTPLKISPRTNAGR